MMLWLVTFLAGLLLAVAVPELRPLLSGCAWVLLLLPAVAVAGMAPRYARRHEAVGEWSWRAWGYRIAGLAVALLAVGAWSQMGNLPTNTTIIGVLVPLAHLATLGLLGAALAAGNADQRDDDARWAAEMLRQLQPPRRTVWSGYP